MAQKKQVRTKTDQSTTKTKPASKVKKKISQSTKTKTLSPKDEAFAKEYARNGRNGRQAMLVADPSLKPKTAAVYASDKLKNVEVLSLVEEEERTLKQALLDAGVGPTKIATRVNTLLDAEKTIYRNNIKTGKIEEVGTEPHYDAIDKGLKHATAIFGVVNPEVRTGNQVYNFFINPDLRKKVDDVEAEIKQSLFEALPKDD